MNPETTNTTITAEELDKIISEYNAAMKKSDDDLILYVRADKEQCFHSVSGTMEKLTEALWIIIDNQPEFVASIMGIATQLCKTDKSAYKLFKKLVQKAP